MTIEDFSLLVQQVRAVVPGAELRKVQDVVTLANPEVMGAADQAMAVTLIQQFDPLLASASAVRDAAKAQLMDPKPIGMAILDIMNETRTAAGLKTVTWDDVVARASAQLDAQVPTSPALTVSSQP